MYNKSKHARLLTQELPCKHFKGRLWWQLDKDN